MRKEVFLDLIGENITISFDAKALVDDIHFIDAYFRDSINGGRHDASSVFKINGEYQRFYYAVNLSDINILPNDIQIRFRGNKFVPGGSENTEGFAIRKVKIEKTTPWLEEQINLEGRNLVLNSDTYIDRVVSF